MAVDVEEPSLLSPLRPPVPSERLRARGVTVADAPDPAPRAALPTTTRGDTPGDGGGGFARYVGQLNPWRIAAGASVTPLFVIGLLGLLGNADSQALFVLIPQMRPAFGYDLQFLVVFNYVLNLGQTLGSPLMGYVADRVRRVWLLRAGGIAVHLGSLTMGFSTGPGMLLGGRALTTAGQTVNQPAALPLLTDCYPPARRAAAFGFVMQAGSIGSVLAPLLAGVIAAGYGWRTAFIVLGAASLVLTSGYFLVREPRRGEQDRLAMGADAATAAREQAPPRWKESWRALSAVSTLRRVWVAMPFLSAASFVFLLIPIYFSDIWHLGPAAYGAVAAAEAGTTFTAQLVAAVVTERLLVQRPAAVLPLVGGICVALAVSVVAVAAAPVLWMAIIAACVASACSFLCSPGFSPPLLSVISLVVPPRVRALGMQSYQPFTLLAFPILYFIVGAIQSAGADARVQLLPYVPIFLVAAAILASGGLRVRSDMRSALAASMADEAARRAEAEGRGVMLVCRDVDVVHEGTRVLFGLDLDVRRGEILALLGTNGAGKSTLLRAIAGIQEASSGAILLEGVDITHSPAHLVSARGAVLVPGGRAVFPRLSVAENLELATGGERPAAMSRDEVLDLFPALRARLDERAGSLSGGEQQMLALAQAFLLDPTLLMVDELTLGLAPQVVDQLLDVLRRLHARGVTIILVEQSVNLALTIADRAVFMEKGRVVFEGPTHELLARGDLARSVFLGQSRGAGALLAGPAAARSTGDGGPVLRVEGAGVRFGGVQALRGVDLTVSDGEIVGFIGPNGAGKSTLFDVISGFVTPTAGRVVALGLDMTAMAPEQRARRGVVRSFQNLRLFAAMTVREVVTLALERHLQAGGDAATGAVPRGRLRPRSDVRVGRRVDTLLEGLGLAHTAEQFVGELSTGTRRIVDLACMLAQRPRILLLDEPSSGLAQSETEELGPLIGRIAKEAGCSILLVEHDLPLVSAIAGRLVAMDQGRIIADGLPAVVLDDPAVVSAYLGASDAATHRSGLLRGVRAAADPTEERNPA